MNGNGIDSDLPHEAVPTPYEAACLVAGEWRSGGSRIDRRSPYSGDVVSRAAVADEAMVAAALESAHASRSLVEELSPATRADVLERAAELVDVRRETFARLLALELGKPVKDGRTEMVRVSDTFRVSALEARQIGGEVLPTPGWQRGIGTTALTYRAPVGVVVAITPFNAPANLLAHKIAPAFAAGNAAIVKPPPQAPGVSTELIRLLLDAGMPSDAVQLVHGGAEVGGQLCASNVVNAISFTGSAAAGDSVARAAGPKRLVLELGGNAATIVCADADISSAARIVAATGFSNSGQSCISVQRVYVHRSVFDDFTDATTSAVRKLKLGDPLDDEIDVGSMVDEAAAARVHGWLQEAVSDGATIACGGDRSGATLEPTVVVDPSPKSRVVLEEVFGAAVVLLPYDDFDAVLDICNESRYGLQAGLFTRDIGRVFGAWRRLEVGGLVVNGTSNFRLDHVPFGGMKDSGMGRESPRWMIDDYTVTKSLLLRDLSLWGADDIA